MTVQLKFELEFNLLPDGGVGTTMETDLSIGEDEPEDSVVVLNAIVIRETVGNFLKSGEAVRREDLMPLLVEQMNLIMQEDNAEKV